MCGPVSDSAKMGGVRAGTGGVSTECRQRDSQMTPLQDAMITNSCRPVHLIGKSQVSDHLCERDGFAGPLVDAEAVAEILHSSISAA